MSLIFHYTPEGLAIPDHNCEQWVIDQYSDSYRSPQEAEFSTENVIAAARALLVQKKIPYLIFKFNGKVVEASESGSLPEWPVGFGDHFQKWVRIITTTQRPRLPDPAAYPDWVHTYTVRDSSSLVKCEYGHSKIYSHGGRCEPNCPECKSP